MFLPAQISIVLNQLGGITLCNYWCHYSCRGGDGGDKFVFIGEIIEGEVIREMIVWLSYKNLSTKIRP